MVQQEVAERLCAQPGNLSILGLQALVYSQPRLVMAVAPVSFWPKPKVASAIVRLDKIISWPYLALEEKVFWQVVKVGFSAKRKTLFNNLAAGFKLDRIKTEQWLKQAGLSGLVRAQELSLENWLNLTKYLV